jgi:hypothetical protein
VTSKVYVALRVPTAPQRAFEVFTREIAKWWQPGGLFPITASGDGALFMEQGVGGRVLTTLPDGQTYEIGRILVWEVGHRLAFTWRPESFSPELSTEVDVRFESVGNETRVSIEHRGWDTIPRKHVARHGFPEHATLKHVSQWWRMSLGTYFRQISQL